MRQVEQEGFVLVTSLLVLVVALVLGLSSSQVSRLEEGMSGNFRAASLAKMSAEYGASEHFSTVRGSKDSYKNDIPLLSSARPQCSDYSAGDETAVVLDSSSFYSDVGGESMEYTSRYSYYECIDELKTEDGSLQDFFVVKVVGEVMAGTEVVAKHEINNVYVHELVYPGGFGTGILGENVTVTGQSFVEGGVHANTNLDVSLHNKSDPSLAVLTSGFDRDIPSASAFVSDFKAAYDAALDDAVADDPDFDTGGVIDIQGYTVAAFQGIASGKVYGSDYCTLDNSVPSEVVDGAVVFCDGEMVVKSNYPGDLTNVVMIATGDITFNGSGGVLNQPLTMGVISSGNINFNGSRDSYGLFWAGGDIDQSGNSSMNGSIVAQGDVTSTGGINFIATEEVDIPVTKTEIQLQLLSWFE